MHKKDLIAASYGQVRTRWECGLLARSDWEWFKDRWRQAYGRYPEDGDWTRTLRGIDRSQRVRRERRL